MRVAIVKAIKHKVTEEIILITTDENLVFYRSLGRFHIAYKPKYYDLEDFSNKDKYKEIDLSPELKIFIDNVFISEITPDTMNIIREKL